MKQIKVLMLLMAVMLFSSCVSVRIDSDYDSRTSFNEYKTYAFYKKGIDEATINDIDKRRILRAIDAEMTKKGFVKSQTPDFLVSIFTKEREDVNFYGGGFGWGYGWYGNYGMGMGPSVYTSIQGSLFVDLLDAKTKELIWQGEGRGYLTQNKRRKEQRINEFVTRVLSQYPPEK